MAYPDMQKYPPDQRAAICHSKFREESMHPDFERILSKFIKRYGKEGTKRFVNFIKKNSLDILKAYNPQSQFQESFEWIEPLIKPYKQDHEAKYYLVSALTADISMNNTDYGPEDRLAREDSSMNWRPVNIGHDHNRWLAYPRTRVDFSAMNEFTLEATLRVDNQDKWLQDKLDSGAIAYPSIEGRPHPIEGRYHFTGLALLEKGVDLPGEPLSEIVPLVFNESVGKSLCEFKDGRMVCECETKQIEVKESMSEEDKPMLNEQEVPDATNAPNKTAKDDAGVCPANYHWDTDANKCVPDVQEECEAGWHFDEALQKCIPDNPQVNESKLLLKIADLELENIQKNDLIKAAEDDTKEKDNRITALTENAKRDKAAANKKIEELTNHKYMQEGVISENNKAITKLEKQLDVKNKEKIQDEKTIQVWQRRCEEATESRDKYKEQADNERKSRETVFGQNQALLAENLKLTSDLTEAKNREVQFIKERKDLQEGLAKAMKHQKYVYEFLKSKGFEIVT
jgi:hypothetical protein